MEDKPVTKRTDDARQGVTGHNVRYVLFWSMSAVVLLFGFVWLVFTR